MLIRLIIRFFPNLLEFAKISSKTYYRFHNSRQEWKILDRKIKLHRKKITYNIPSQSVSEAEITLTSVDSKVSEKQRRQMVKDKLESMSRKELNELWWNITPIRNSLRWKLSWISLRHKDINRD